MPVVFRPLVAALCAGALLIPAAADAGTKCKSGEVASGGLTEDQAIAAWTTKVKHSYGAEWSNFNLARNKSFSQQPLPPVSLTFVSAIPCRHT